MRILTKKWKQNGSQKHQNPSFFGFWGALGPFWGPGSARGAKKRIFAGKMRFEAALGGPRGAPRRLPGRSRRPRRSQKGTPGREKEQFGEHFGWKKGSEAAFFKDLSEKVHFVKSVVLPRENHTFSMCSKAKSTTFLCFFAHFQHLLVKFMFFKSRYDFQWYFRFG